MKRYSLFLFSLFVVTAVQLSTVWAEDAKDTVVNTVNKVRETVKTDEGKISPESLDGKLRNIIAPVFDFEEMARKSLAAHWSEASAEQQKEFVSVFSDLLAVTYLKRIRENVATSTVNVIGEVTKGEKVEVRTNTISSDGEVQINYRLYRRDNGWKIYDVIIANVGLVSNYRGEFSGIIRKEGMDGLLKRLREKKV